MRCTYCGAELEENAEFCIKCGNRVGEISQAERFSTEGNMQMMQGDNIQKSRTGTIIVLIVFVLLVSVIALLCIKVFVKDAPDGQEETQTVREWNMSETEEEMITTTEVTEEVISSIKSDEPIDVSEENINNTLDTDWIYTNNELGYSLLIPASFSGSDEETDYGGSALFYNDTSAYLNGFGYKNIASDTPESIIKEYPEASYTYVGNNYCCVSFVDGTDIVYMACHIDANLVYGFSITYPQEDKEQYDDMINNMLHYLVNE